jgi:hypothetical protein
MPTGNDFDGVPFSEFRCPGHQLKNACARHAPRGVVYSCECGPLTSSELEALERASAQGMRVRLVSLDGEILLADVQCATMAADRVFVEGRLVEAVRIRARR